MNSEEIPLEEQIEDWMQQSFSGQGSRVLRIDPLLGYTLIAFKTETTSEHVMVAGILEDGTRSWVGTNAVGTYEGTTLFNGQQAIVALEVKCSVGWSLDIRPLTEAKLWAGPQMSGIGDEVLLLPEDAMGLRTVALRVGASGYTGVWGHSNDRDHLLFNKVDARDEEAILPNDVWFVSIRTSGPWAMVKG